MCTLPPALLFDVAFAFFSRVSAEAPDAFLSCVSFAKQRFMGPVRRKTERRGGGKRVGAGHGVLAHRERDTDGCSLETNQVTRKMGSQRSP